MTGEFRHTLDTKGRLFIPARLREELGNNFYITVSDEKCIWAYSAEGWDEFIGKIRTLPYVDRKKMRPFFSCASKCELDSQGRILIPQNLRAFADLQKNVVVLGCDDHAEIWNAETWEAVNSSELSPEYLADVLKELRI